MHFQITVFLTFVAMAIAGTPCLATKDHVEVPDHMIHHANPLYVNTNTNENFYKYSTNVGDATEEEMNALEFTSSYASDDSGNMWLVSEEFLPVIQITKAYLEQFAGDLPTDIIGDEHYVFNATYFNQRLKEVRADAEVLQQAQLNATWKQETISHADLVDVNLNAPVSSGNDGVIYVSSSDVIISTVVLLTVVPAYIS
ncbi:hypothetical protein NLG97_g1291 [Lecanicillium saksenae]|uniref:Uncharacterized protein n=1 Tax=Lecanicillium saksenae TaxID=468837 RepID=A0ACC1R6U8_9HYPO|nr:hypothetical protein NLG97_g1291 [Lecanicillium saksenae]